MSDATWAALLEDRAQLATRLVDYARPRRWFRAKARAPKAARVSDLVPLEADQLVLAVVEIAFDEGKDLYVIPLARATRGATTGIIAELTDGVLVDALATGGAAPALLGLIRDAGTRAGAGRLRGERFPAFTAEGSLTVKVPQGEQTNSTLVFGDRLLLKVYRQLTAGPNPELEVGRFLTEQCQPPCGPPVLGALSYTDAAGTTFSVGIAHQFVPNDGDAWTVTLRALEGHLAAVSGLPPSSPHVSRLERAVDARVPFVAQAATLGQRTGELHRALQSRSDLPDFAPEPLSASDRKRLVTRASGMLADKLAALAGARLSPADRALAQALLSPSGKERILSLLAEFGERALTMQKTRTHGDLHLGQVLARGDDFTIIDFEGEPARPLSERRAKGSPLRDVMGMVRSFDYAAATALRGRTTLQPWAERWTRAVEAAYLQAYLATAPATLFPSDPAELSVALTFYELEKVIYELGYELDNRPDWVAIPLRGLARIAEIEAQ